jgi:hypothetical protein
MLRTGLIMNRRRRDNVQVYMRVGLPLIQGYLAGWLFEQIDLDLPGGRLRWYPRKNRRGRCGGKYMDIPEELLCGNTKARVDPLLSM